MLSTRGVVFAQEFRGAMTGTITDPQGALVSGAEVEARNIDTNTSLRASTNTSGTYVLPFVGVGHYNVTATAPGFKRAVRNNVEVRVGDRLELNFALEIGQVNDQITVTTETELLETQNATHGQVIDSKSVAELPSLGRNVFIMTTLSTGVTWANPQPSNSGRPWDNNGMDNFNINGSQGLTNALLLDGLPNDSVESGGPANLTVAVSPDATQEFKVQTNTYDAEFGRTGGGTVNITLKSGTNKLHGAAYDYERNTIFNANLFQNNAANISRAPFHWHQPGAEVDGPVRIPGIYDGRNRTFFMVNLEWVNLVQPSTAINTVPSDLQRQGDFNGTRQNNGNAITMYDPLTTQMVNGQNTRQPFAGNRIPMSRMNPVALAILRFVPSPNAAGTITGTQNLNVTSYSKVNYAQQVLRLDHNVSDRERLSMRFARNGDFAPGGPTGFLSDLALGAGYARKNRGGGIDLTSTLSPTLILVSRAGYEMHLWEYNNPGYPFNLSSLGISSSLISQLPVQSFPAVAMTNYTSFGPGRNYGNEYNASGTGSWNETLSKLAGKHSLKFGSIFRVMLNNQRSPSSSFGSLGFTAAWTQQNALNASAASGNAVASMLLGYPATGSILNNQGMAYSSRYWGGFFQDDWRITRNLTVNVGLRWDYESPITERYNRLEAGFDTSAASPLQVTGLSLKGGLRFVDSNNRLPFHRDLNNWQPRVGVAYQILHNTVFRAGYGISYLPTFDIAGISPFNTTTSLTASTDGNLTPAVDLTNPYPGGVVKPTGSTLGLGTLMGQGVAFGTPSRNIPYVQQFSAGFQQSLPLRSVLDVSYSGSRTHDMAVSRNINALDPNYLSLGNALNAKVANPMAGLLPQSPALNGMTITQQQLLLPYPQFQTITQNNLSIGYASYDSLQIKLEKRFSHGFHALLSYTWAKALQATSYLNSGQDPEKKLARTLSSWDEPYRIVLSGGYQFPSLAKTNAVLRGVAGGWQVNMITTWQGGRPVAEPDAWSAGIDTSLGSKASLKQWFNTCTLSTTGARQNCADASQPVAWYVRPSFTLRTSSSYFPNIRFPRPMTMDASVFKDFHLHEGIKLQFRFEAFNVTNTTWFGSPNTTVGGASFGVITPSQANDPRMAQAGLRLTF